MGRRKRLRPHDLVRAKLDLAGLSVCGLAELTGHEKSVLSRKLRGKIRITADELIVFGKALGCDPADFLPRAGA